MKPNPANAKGQINPSDVTAKVEALWRLQENERQTAAIRVSLEAAPHRMSLLAARLEETEARIAQAKERMADLQKVYRQHDGEAQSIQAQIDKSNEKLKTVKTNKEYQAGLQEIEDLSKLQSGIEDKMLECLEAIDEAESAVASEQESFDAFSRQVEEEKAQMEREAAQMRQNLQRLLSLREQIVGAMDAELLKKYEQTKQYTGSTVVAAVSRSVCQGCNMNIPPQMYNELQRFDRLLVCPHCERVIYPSGILNEDRPA